MNEIEDKPKGFGEATCDHCGKKFTKSRIAQKNCSTLCRNRGWWKRKKATEDKSSVAVSQ